MVAIVNRSRATRAYLLDHICVNDDIDLWLPHDCIYITCRIIHALPGDYYNLQFQDGSVKGLNLRLEQWRFIGQSAQRVMAALNHNNRSSTTQQ